MLFWRIFVLSVAVDWGVGWGGVGWRRLIVVVVAVAVVGIGLGGGGGGGALVRLPCWCLDECCMPGPPRRLR